MQQAMKNSRVEHTRSAVEIEEAPVRSEEEESHLLLYAFLCSSLDGPDLLLTNLLSLQYFYFRHFDQQTNTVNHNVKNNHTTLSLYLYDVPKSTYRHHVATSLNKLTSYSTSLVIIYTPRKSGSHRPFIPLLRNSRTLCCTSTAFGNKQQSTAFARSFRPLNGTHLLRLIGTILVNSLPSVKRSTPCKKEMVSIVGSRTVLQNTERWLASSSKRGCNNITVNNTAHRRLKMSRPHLLLLIQSLMKTKKMALYWPYP